MSRTPLRTGLTLTTPCRMAEWMCSRRSVSIIVHSGCTTSASTTCGGWVTSTPCAAAAPPWGMWLEECHSGNVARGMLLGECCLGNVARGMRLGEYGSGNAAQKMLLGECCSGNAARGMLLERMRADVPLPVSQLTFGHLGAGPHAQSNDA
eukprot:1176369-Prorocentrum_minimum.AAC.1